MLLLQSPQHLANLPLHKEQDVSAAAPWPMGIKPGGGRVHSLYDNLIT